VLGVYAKAHDMDAMQRLLTEGGRLAEIAQRAMV